MTTIACNREEMYGDLQYTNGTYKWKGNGKVFKFKAHPATCPNDFIVGFSGTAGDLVTVKHFFDNPDGYKKPPKVAELYGLVLTDKGNIYRFNDYTRWLEVREPFAAIGSGGDFALGAMSAGATPKEAIKQAMRYDVYTGLGIKGHCLT